jgi:hypothetical protein
MKKNVNGEVDILKRLQILWINLYIDYPLKNYDREKYWI